jgi:hypothetical protein
MSLDWLAENITKIQSAGSLALSKICMETYGRRWPANAPALPHLHERNGFLENVPVAAWTCLALSPRSQWWTPAPEKTT